MTGRNWAAATMPSQIGSCVSSRTSHAWATCCIHVPTREMACPAKNSRKFRCWNGLSPSDSDSRLGVEKGATDQRSRSGCGLGPPSTSIRCSSRWARRARASSIMAARRAAFASRISIWWSTRACASRRSDRRSSGSPVCWIALAIPLADVLVLEQLADLREREARVVTQVADELEALEVGVVVQAVVAVRPRGRLEETHLLVVADGPRGQAGLGRDLVDAQQGRRGSGVGRVHRPPDVTTTLTLT